LPETPPDEITEATGKDSVAENVLQEAYTYGSFLLRKHIQDKFGKKLSKGNVFRRIPKKKSTKEERKNTIEEQIEGKALEKDLREAKYRADRAATIMEGVKADCGYLQEIFREELFDEWTGDQNQESRKAKSNRKERIQSQLTGSILAKIRNLENYLENMITPRNGTELYDLLNSVNFEETIEAWSEKVRKITRDANIEIAQKQKNVRQTMYATDQKKTTRLLSKDQTPQCEVEHGLLRKIFNDR
jgi:hypothetical protein